jgi:hypothetical protein
MAAMLASAVESCTNAWWQLDLTYTSGKGRIYTQEEDQFILCTTHQIGYGNWDRLKQEIRRSWQFRFDWFLKSRTPQELGRRCDTLIKMLEKVRSASPPPQRGPVLSLRQRLALVCATGRHTSLPWPQGGEKGQQHHNPRAKESTSHIGGPPTTTLRPEHQAAQALGGLGAIWSSWLCLFST